MFWPSKLSTHLFSLQAPDPIVKIWDMGRGAEVCSMKAHEGNILCMAFSLDDCLLCTVGYDKRRRVQIKVWNVQELCVDAVSTNDDGVGGEGPKAGGRIVWTAISGRGAEDRNEAGLVARQISDFDIVKIKFSPFEQQRLVSCGKENVRFWRIKRGHLPACPAILNEFSRNTEFTDLAFESSYGKLDDEESPKVVFVSTKQGTLVQVSYYTRELLCVLRLHNDAINCVEVNEGFVVTGSNDRFLRIWPLDFSDYLLEAQNESPVVSASLSGDGLKLLIGTSSGSIGILDVVTHAYTTALRSHTSRIASIASDPSPNGKEFATAGDDGTIRIWDLESGSQRYEFLSFKDPPTSLSYHPSQHAIVCGFQSGCIRLFDIPTTSTLQEYQQHRGAVVQLLYRSDGKRLYSAATCGTICVYDVSRDHQPMRMISVDFPTDRISISLSPDSLLLAAASATPFNVIIFDAETMNVRRNLRKPATGGKAWTLGNPKINNQEAGEEEGLDPEVQARSIFRDVMFTSPTVLLAATSDEVVEFRVTGLDSSSSMDKWASEFLQRSVPSTDAVSFAAPLTPLQKFTTCSRTGAFGFSVVGEGSDEGRFITVWNLDKGRKRKEEAFETERITGGKVLVRAGPGGIISGSDGGFWDAQIFKEHFTRITTLEISEKSGKLISGDESGAIFLWRISEKILSSKLEEPSETHQASKSEFLPSFPAIEESPVDMLMHGGKGLVSTERGSEEEDMKLDGPNTVPLPSNAVNGRLPESVTEDKGPGYLELLRVWGHGARGKGKERFQWLQRQGLLIYSVGSELAMEEIESGTVKYWGSITEVSSIGYSPSRGLLAIGSRGESPGEAKLSVWAIMPESSIEEIGHVKGIEGLIICISFSYDSSFIIAVTSMDLSSRVYVLEPDTMSIVKSADTYDEIYDVKPLPSLGGGTRAFVTGGSGGVVFWDLAEQQERKVQALLEPCAPTVAIRALATGKIDNVNVVSAGGGTEGRLWIIKARANEPITLISWTVGLKDESIECLTMHGSIAVVGSSSAFWIFDMSAALSLEVPTLINSIPLASAPLAMQWDDALTDGVLALTDGSIWTYHLQDYNLQSMVKLIAAPSSTTTKLAISNGQGSCPASNLIATTCDDSMSFQLWALEHSTPILQYLDPSLQASAVSFWPGKPLWVVCGQKDGIISIIDLEGGEVKLVIEHEQRGGAEVTDFLWLGGDVLLSMNKEGKIFFDELKIVEEQLISSTKTVFIMGPEAYGLQGCEANPSRFTVLVREGRGRDEFHVLAFEEMRQIADILVSEGAETGGYPVEGALATFAPGNDSHVLVASNVTNGSILSSYDINQIVTVSTDARIHVHLCNLWDLAEMLLLLLLLNPDRTSPWATSYL